MPVRDSWATGTSTFDAEEVRVANAAPWTPATNAVKALTGIKPAPGNPGAVTATGTPDAFVHVAPFAAIIQSTRAANAGVYPFVSDTIVDINILSTPANATNPRNDLIICHQPDTFYSDANSTGVVRSVVGTPSGTPADPSLAAYPDAVTLARVRVDANATTITAAKITDLRPAPTVAVNGILPTATSTTRNALTGLYDGLPVYRRDRNWVEIYDGAAYRVLAVPICSSSADLSAITNPETGATAFVTGDDAFYRYSGTWRRVDWRQGWGLLGGRHYTGNNATLAAGIGTTEAAANMSTGAVTTTTGRRYRATTRIRFNISNTTSHAVFRIREGGVSGTERGYLIRESCIGNTGLMFTMDCEFDELAGAVKDFWVTAAVFQSAGLVNVVRSGQPGSETFVEIHDIGPALGALS